MHMHLIIFTKRNMRNKKPEANENGYHSGSRAETTETTEYTLLYSFYFGVNILHVVKNKF